MFYVNVDKLPRNGGQDAIRRIVFNDKGQTKNLFDLVKAKTAEQGKTAAHARRSPVWRRPRRRGSSSSTSGTESFGRLSRSEVGVRPSFFVFRNAALIRATILTQNEKRGSDPSLCLRGAKLSRLGAVFGDREIVLHVFRANHVRMRLAGGALGQLRHLLV